MMQDVYKTLPIGIEVYDRDGFLVDINDQALTTLEFQRKEDVLGNSIFNHPYLTGNLAEKIRAGEEVKIIVGYDSALLENLFKNSHTGIRNIEFKASSCRDESGAINQYWVISQDVTDYMKLRDKYDDLHHYNIAILETLPLGVNIYAADGTMLYINEACCKIWGVDHKEIMEKLVNIKNNPVLTESIKNAILSGIPLHEYFSYNFDAVIKNSCLNSTCTQIHNLEFKGKPITDAMGRSVCYICTIEDITEKLKTEDLLSQSRQKTEMAMQAADIMLWEFDVKSQLFYSDNEPLNGYDHSKPVTPNSYIDIIHPDDQELMKIYLNQMITGKVISFDADFRTMLPDSSEWQHCSVNGSPYQKDADGGVLKYVGTRKNNTEQQKRKMLLDRILNNIPLPIYIKDVDDDFRYVFCNEESEKLFGMSVNNTTYDIMDEEEVERIRKTDLEVFKTGKPHFGLERVSLKDGRSYDTIVRKSVIEDGGKRLLLTIRWDQSIHNDLQRRSKLLTLTLESMHAFTWFYEPDKERINFGDGFENVLRRTTEINTLDKFLACVHPDDTERFRVSLEALADKDHAEWTVEYRVDINGQENYIWVESRGTFETTMINDIPYKYMFGMTISIDAYKQTELALLKNKEELNRLIHQNELILNNTNSGLAYITTDYIVQWENISICSASLSLEAYKKGEHCYKSAYNRSSPCEDCVMQRALASHQMEQKQFNFDNGHQVEIFATPVFSGETIEGIVIRIDDVTQRQKMIKELQEAKALAEQSDKLKSTFLANMSHEIRTPLNAIVGFSELLITNPNDEDREEYIRIVNSNNELLLKLISDILDLSKIEAGSIDFKYEEFDLAVYFDDMAMSMRQRVMNPNVRLIDVNPHDHCIVNLDKNRVAQLMTNYVTNAIKYTPKGFIEMGYESLDKGVRLYVKDSGIGVPDEKKAKVFHRFAKLDEFAQGTGLGLSICKAIAEAMGGHVGFESQYGEGSVFWTFLPCEPRITGATPSDAPETEAEQLCNDQSLPANVDPQASNAKRTILAAEDIDSNFLLLSSVLRMHFNVLRAHNGQQAVDIVRDNHIDLLLMDMKMPVMDGLTATAEIRKFNSRIPIIALTANAFETDRLAALAAGCNEFLVKPIDKSRLMSVLQKYCPAVRKTKTKG